MTDVDIPETKKSKIKIKPYTLGDLQAGLKKKDGGPSVAFVNFKVKYVAAAEGIFDFPADVEFFDEINANGYTIKAKKIVLKRLELLIAKKGAKALVPFDGIAQERNIQAYKAEVRRWIALSSTKKRKDYKHLKQKLDYYLTQHKSKVVSFAGKPVVKKASRKKVSKGVAQ